MRVKQEDIKYHFLKSLWYDSTWEGTPVSLTISEHSTHSANDKDGLAINNPWRLEVPVR